MKNQVLEEHSWLELLREKTEEMSETEECKSLKPLTDIAFENSDYKIQTAKYAHRDILGKLEACLSDKKISEDDFQKNTLIRFEEYERKRKDKLVNQKKEQLMKEMQEYTLTPKINEQIGGTKHESLFNRLDQIIETRKAKMEIKKEEYIGKEARELKECTFSPRILSKAKRMKRSIQDLFDWNDKKKKRLVDKSLKKFETQKKEAQFVPKISKKSKMMVMRRRKNNCRENKVKVEDRLMRYLEKKKKNRQEAIKLKENEYMSKSPRRHTPKRKSTKKRRSASTKMNRAFELRCQSNQRKLVDDTSRHNSKTARSRRRQLHGSELTKLNGTFLTKDTDQNCAKSSTGVNDIKSELGSQPISPKTSKSLLEESSSQLLFSFRKGKKEAPKKNTHGKKQAKINFKKRTKAAISKKKKRKAKKKIKRENKENSICDVSRNLNIIKSRTKGSSFAISTPLRDKPTKKEINKKYSKRKIVKKNVKRQLEESILVSNGTSSMLDNLTKINNKLKFMNSMNPQTDFKSGDGISNMNTQSQLSNSSYNVSSFNKSPLKENIFIKNMEELNMKTNFESYQKPKNPFIELCEGFNAVDVEIVRDGD